MQIIACPDICKKHSIADDRCTSLYSSQVYSYYFPISCVLCTLHRIAYPCSKIVNKCRVGHQCFLSARHVMGPCHPIRARGSASQRGTSLAALTENQSRYPESLEKVLGVDVEVGGESKWSGRGNKEEEQEEAGHI